VTRPRAADDFPAIRARMQELRRERVLAPVDDNLRWAEGPRGRIPAAAARRLPTSRSFRCRSVGCSSS
jgi:hypothetical protein